MLIRAPELGRVITPSSITTTTVVSTSHLYEASVQKYVGYFICRPDAATAAAADRVRRVTSQSAPSTLTHNQTNYTDTTVTSEQAELLAYDPYLFDYAIDVTLGRTRRLDRSRIPSRQSTNRYWLGDMDWIEQPSHIAKVTFSDDPILNQNRYFEKWNSYDSSGILKPDSWTLAGSGATMARSTTANRRGTSTVAITRAGTDCTLLNTVGLLENGVTGDSLRGKTVYAVGVCQSAVASQMRLRVTDGVDTTNSSYHTGGGTLEELTVTHTVNAAATTLQVGFSVETSNTVCYAEEGYAYENGGADANRQDAFYEHEVEPGWDQGNGTLAIILPQMGRSGSFFIYSQRPYPRLDSTRLLAMTHDADVIDAPAPLIAAGAIARLYEGLSAMQGQDGNRYAALSADWNRRFEQMALQHLGMPDTQNGVRFPRRMLAAPVR